MWFLSSFIKVGVCVLLGAIAIMPMLASPHPLSVTVAAAATLRFALQDIAANFKESTGAQVKLVFGASGNLYSQIKQGAPFDLFLSADEDYVLRLYQEGISPSEGRVYAKGRIGILVPKGGSLKADSALSGLKLALAQGRLRHFAIANPDIAPYGARAKEVLEYAGLWREIKNNLVVGENISQAAQFALSGSTQGGLIAYSLALAPELSIKSNFALIPESWHKPLLQRLVLLHPENKTASAFDAYLAQPAAQQVFQKYGYSMLSL